MRGRWWFDFVHEAESTEVTKVQAKEYVDQEIAPQEVELDEIKVTREEGA
jgi:hypothetical protein